MVETRGAKRQSMGLPAKAPAYAKRAPVGTSGASSKARITTKEGHWSGAKEGGAQGTPTVQIWKGGEMKQTIRGVESRQFYIDAIGEALGKVPSA